jgi:predicted metal-dependent peptidase
VAEARGRLTGQQWDRLDERLRAGINSAVGLLPGVLSGTQAQAVGARGAGAVNWRQALRRYVRSVLEPEPAFGRPPRRFPHLVGVVPGGARRPQKARVMAVIDTSGSVPPEALTQIADELDEMRRWHEVHVVECDATIHAVYRLTQRLPRVHGRGGTDLRPPFAVGVLAKVRPEVVVYFTDGAGPAPDRAPGVPVLWCLTRGGTKPTGWGWVLTLPC